MKNAEKYTEAMKKFADEYELRDPDCMIKVIVSENGKDGVKEYEYEAAAIVGIKRGSKAEFKSIDFCVLQKNIFGAGGGVNKRFLSVGVKGLLKKLKQL